MSELNSGRWTCPKCGRANRGNFCAACGERRDKRGYAPRTLLPEADVLHWAHKAACTRVNQTIPFFVLTAILTGAIGYVFGALCSLLIPFGGVLAVPLYQIFLGNIFEYGECIAGLYLYRDKDISMGTLFEGMHDYARILCGIFWYKLRLGLWMLVPVVGTVKSYSYRFTPYILYERPDLSPEEALQESVRMTKGHKMELFIRYIKFTGWRLLNLVSFGAIGVLYYYAYQNAVWAGFYDAAKPSPTRRRGTHYAERKTDPESAGADSDVFITPEPL